MNDQQPGSPRNNRLHEPFAIEGTIGFVDLCLRLWHFRWRILGLSVVGVALGFAVASLVPKTWRATAIVQIGKVSHGSDRPLSLRPLIEEPAIAAERIMDPAFLRSVLESLSLPGEEDSADEQARHIRNSLSVSIPRGTDLLGLRVAARDREMAHRAAAAVVRLLSKEHERIAHPTVRRLRGQLEATDAELARAQAERDRLLGLASGRDRPGVGERFAESVLLGDLLGRKEAEIRALGQARLQLEEQLAPSQTYPTAVLNDIHVPLRAASPRRSLFMAGGGLIGLVSGSLWALLSATRVRRHPSDKGVV